MALTSPTGERRADTRNPHGDRAGSRALRSRSVVRGDVVLFLMREDAPQRYRERGALAFGASDSQVTSHPAREITTDREAETRAAAAASVVRPHLHEWFED